MNSRSTLFSVLIMAACLTQFAADIYAPSIPAMARDFEASIDSVQWSMSIYMFGVAVSQLVYGPLSEGIGRKPPMIFGLLIMLIGSIVCAMTISIDLVIFGRFVQGIGAGACASLWRSVFRDSFSKEELAQYSSYLVTAVMFVIPTAPLIGGYLQQYFGWYASFVFMTIYSIIALFGVIFGFRETNTSYHISKLKMKFVVSKYLILLRSPTFMGMTCGTFLTYGAFFSWFVIGPVLLIDRLGISPMEFGWLTFICGGISYGLAGFINGRLVKTWGMTAMLRIGWGSMIISGIAMILGYYLAGMNIWYIMIPVVLLFFGSTFIWPNAFATAFSPFGDIAGYAGALYGFMQVSGAAVLAAFAAYLPDDNQLILAITIIITSTTSWLLYELLVRNDINQT